MVVEKVKVMMVINALAMIPNTFFASSVLVRKTDGIYPDASKNTLVSMRITPNASTTAKMLYNAGYSQILLLILLKNLFSFNMEASPFQKWFITGT